MSYMMFGRRNVWNLVDQDKNRATRGSLETGIHGHEGGDNTANNNNIPSRTRLGLERDMG